MSSSPHWKSRNEQKQSKNARKGTKKRKWRIEKMMEKRIKKMILGLITLKYNFGLFILSFESINPGLHYVPRKSILIECGYLYWRDFPWGIFHSQQGTLSLFSAKIILINHSPIRDEFWIFECMMGQLNEKKNRENEWKEKRDSRVKTQKGQSRTKTRRFQRLMGGANKRMKG